MPTVDRRRFLRHAALAGLAPGFAFAQAEEAPPLPIPPLLQGATGRPIELTAQAGTTAFWPEAPSATAGYNGSFLGPTLRLARGSDVPVVVRNTLAEPTTVHWHGLLVPSSVDGGPHQEIAPGASWQVVLPLRQPGTTAWYHAHPHGRTGPQVYAGLAGLLIVDDPAEHDLGLPARYGVDDLPLILQDRLFDRAGRMVYPRDPMAAMLGVQGNVLLVNGVPQPRAEVPRGPVRLRLLNAANARVFSLAFADGRDFHWIGTDGGLLRRPVALQRLALAPGQRAELLVDCSDGRPATLVHDAPAGGAGVLVRLVPRGNREGVRPMPQQLARWERPDAARALRRRRLVLTMGMDGMGMGMMGGMGGMGLHGIDGRAFDMARVDQRVRLGAVEIWEVSAQPSMMMDLRHPFHMHGVQFEVLRRDGQPPPPDDQGRRDTVLVDAPVELLVHFTQPAPELPFMYHCHILEHEDRGMMGQFTVG